jgi:hypothetical protein
VSLGCAADNIEAACDYLREQRNAKVGSIHINVIRPFPEAAVIDALRGKKRVIILERTDEGLAGDNPLARDIRVALGKANEAARYGGLHPAHAGGNPAPVPRRLRHRLARFPPRAHIGAYEFATGQTRARTAARRADGETFFVLGRRPSVRRDQQGHPVAAARRRHRRAVSLHRRLGHDHHGQEPRLDHRRLRPLHLGARAHVRHRRRTRRQALRDGQPEVRLGEEGRAHQLLPHRRAVADQGELRAEPRRRRALLRSRRRSRTPIRSKA